MVVCQFFLRGNCKFGDNCRNEHPAAKQGGFGNSGWTNRASGSSSSSTPSKGTLLPYNAANIACDISPTQDKPLWPLSTYGPAKYEPNLISGLDESSEELRVKAMTAIKAGNVNEYLQYETTKIAAADSVFANARANSTQAFEQAAKQSNFPALAAVASDSKPSTSGGPGSTFPSNSSAFGSTSTFGSTTTPSAFGTSTTTTPSAFGNTTTPSAFGNLGGSTTTSAFGQPSFGKSTFGQSAFGQPSFGQPSASNPLASTGSAFGQTSTPGTSTFGQASNPTTSAFGQPQNTTTSISAFGQPQQSTSAFGQPAQPPATTSAFGQPSFGQATQSPTSSSIIKPASGAFSAFANNGTPSPFGSTANTAGLTTGGAFSAFAGQPSAFGLGAAGANPQQQTGGSVFGQPGFGQPSQVAAANANTTTSAFGSLSQNNTTTSAFGTPSFGQQTTAPTSVFGSGPAFGQTGFSNAGAASTFGTGTQAPSIFGNTSALGAAAPPATDPQHLSVFPTAPSISMSMNSPNTSGSALGSGPASASASDAPDFAGLIKRGGLYVPNATPYDSQLPGNYIELLPKEVVDAFNADKFTWGSVPDWVPPVEVR